ncbi:MAG: hypothetical protein ACJ76I_08915 [Gaiellaceae bacterium]
MAVVLALLLGVASPPPAYVDTGTAHVPLAITSWCWDARCGAPLGASARRAFVRRGAVVRLEVKFDAVDANVSVGGTSTHATARGREVTWTATRTGGLTAYVKYRRGWVLYSGRLAFR